MSIPVSIIWTVLLGALSAATLVVAFKESGLTPAALMLGVNGVTALVLTVYRVIWVHLLNEGE